MKHLSDNGVGYINHLARAWRWSFILFVHGIFPNVWEYKVTSEMNSKAKK